MFADFAVVRGVADVIADYIVMEFRNPEGAAVNGIQCADRDPLTDFDVTRLRNAVVVKVFIL